MPRPWLAAAGLLLALATAGAAPVLAQAPAPAVVVERIERREVSDPDEFIARVEAIEAVDVRARVQGFLRTVHFEAGERVQEGELLFEIEPDSYEASLASARAQLLRAEASREGARRTLARTQELAQRGTAAQATLDEARTAFEVAGADVEAARSAVRTAELELSYTYIIAPIAGQIGRPLYTRGNLVGPESDSLARIVQLDPIRVVFSIAEGLLVSLRQEARRSGGIDPETLDLTLRLPNGTEYKPAGRIEYIESEVNPQTGTVPVRIAFPNPDRLLMPNQFVTLIVREGDSPVLPIVPQTAVLQDRQGRFVYLLGEEQTVAQRRIETGARVENGWAVTQGLEGGELVVVQGVQRLAEGMKVQPSQGRALGEGTGGEGG